MKLADKVKSELARHAEREKAEFLPVFFRARPGGYGEGDRFLGVRVPHQRKIAKKYAESASLGDVAALLKSRFHEHRLTALFMLTEKFRRERDEAERERIARFYLDRLDRVNNWDLVDSSADKILGPYLSDGDRGVLYELAASGELWKQRAAVIATLHFIRNGDFGDTLGLAEMLLSHGHDLIHKAVGWMLREVGKRDLGAETRFLDEHAPSMPRTMLRYAVEKLPPAAKRRYMDAHLHR